MSNFWPRTKVLVAGGSGFIGSHLVESLLAAGAQVAATFHARREVSTPVNLEGVRSRIRLVESDLTRIEDCVDVCTGQEVVINAAHADGSVAFKRAHPAFIFRENLLISLNILEAIRLTDVERALVFSSAEVYSPEAQVPTPESDGFIGLPDRQTEGYAWSKRMTELAAQSFAREYGLKVAIARPNNVYGPRDHFDEEKGRIIPTLIRKASAHDQSLTVWGSGNQVRSFLHVRDLTRALLHLVERFPEPDPINLAGDEEITIMHLAELIVQLLGKTVRVTTEPDQPSGPSKRVLDITRAKRLLAWTPAVPLITGLRETIAFYKECYMEKIALA